MVVTLIGLITFVLGCFITYYLDHTGKSESEKSSIELKEDAIRARQELQDQQDNLAGLLELTIRDSVDETVKSMAAISPAADETQRGALDRRQLYNRSYDEVKRSWSRISEIVTQEGENGEVVAPRKMAEVVPLPEKLDFAKSRFAPQPPPVAEAAVTTSTPAVESEGIGGKQEPEEITGVEELKEDTDLEDRETPLAEPTRDEAELNNATR